MGKFRTNGKMTAKTRKCGLPRVCPHCTEGTPTELRRWFRKNCPHCLGQGVQPPRKTHGGRKANKTHPTTAANALIAAIRHGDRIAAYEPMIEWLKANHASGELAAIYLTQLCEHMLNAVGDLDKRALRQLADRAVLLADQRA